MRGGSIGGSRGSSHSEASMKDVGAVVGINLVKNWDSGRWSSPP